MKRRDTDQLLNGVLSDEGLDDFRRTSLEFGLDTLRRRRRNRRLARTCSIITLPMVLSVLLYKVITSAPEQSTTTPKPLIAAGPGSSSEVQIINDEQLFALFPNRPMALVGEPGHQELVFLDQMTAEDQPVAR
jgi:hypothetical protein